MWIGLSDMKSEGSWEGIDPQYPSTNYSNWDRDEPDGERAENCAVMDLNGKWSDVPCSGQRRFVCEKGGT